MARKIAIGILLAIAAILVFGQLIRPKRTNPPVDESHTYRARLKVPPEIGALLDRSCGDCHSNRTVWPWYSKVAPTMWLIVSDVNEGRGDLNLSDWRYDATKARKKLTEICDEVKEGDMPPWYYTIMHSGTRLSAAERTALCKWTAAEAERVR